MPEPYKAAGIPLAEYPPLTYRPDVRLTLTQRLFVFVLRPLWDWRVELVGAVALAGAWLGLAQVLGHVWSALAVIAVMTVLYLVEPARVWAGRVLHRAATRRAWYWGVRHANLATWNDRVPRITRQRAVPAGDALTVRVPAGSDVTKLETARETVAAAMGVMDVRVSRDRQNAQRAEVVIVRRDPLAGGPPLPWPGLLLHRGSLWQPFPVGTDENGEWVTMSMVERNILFGGEPGAGKSVAMSMALAMAALDPNVRLVLMDGKRVELAPWAGCADRFVGPDVGEAIRVLHELREEMDARYLRLLEERRRKITASYDTPLIVVAVDELALYLNAAERKQSQEFAWLLRDLVARGRAAGVIVIAATQKPSHEVIPTSLRDLFGFRWALRCSTPQASDTVLGAGWASAGYSAATIDAGDRGVGFLLAEGGLPVRLRACHLDDDELTTLAHRAERLRAGRARAALPAGDGGDEGAA